MMMAGMAGSGMAALPASLRVAWDDYPPYQMGGRQDAQPQGLDIELGNAVLRQAGITPQWQRMPWARQLLSLQDGSLDLMISASTSREREDYALWTLPYRAEDAALMAQRESAQPPRSLRELLGKPVRIGMIRGTSYPGEFESLLREAAFQRQITPVRHNEQGLRMLREGRLDYLIDDPVALRYLAQQDGGPPLQLLLWVYRGASRLMLSKRSEARHPGLLAALDQAILELRSSGQLRPLPGSNE
jgi:polar amino acid transport system substrate-binding protein